MNGAQKGFAMFCIFILLVIAFTSQVVVSINAYVIYTDVCHTLEYDDYAIYEGDVYCVDFNSGETMIIDATE